MYSEEDFVPVSALQHLLFCPRQCAFIYIEQVWAENLLTAEGGIMHERAHDSKNEMRDGIRIERGIRLCSHRLGLVGMSDVIEFHKAEKEWMPIPIEYKHGRPKENHCDRVQLCAQALCLEEQLNVKIERGALFYGKTRRREDVAFDENLRKLTEDTTVRLHEFIKAGQTPRPVYSKKCESCSLLSVCMPKLMEKSVSIKQYLEEELRET